MHRALLVLTIAVHLFGSRCRASEDEPKFRNRPLSEWLQMLREDPSTDRRRAALLAVQSIGPAKSPRVIPAVISSLRDDADDKLREAAAATLGRIAERRAAGPLAERTPFTAGRDALVAALRTDRSTRVRTAAAVALGKLDRSDAAGAVPDLGTALASTNTPPPTRSAAAESLRRIGKDAAVAVPAMRQALEDRSADEPIRIRAAQALGNVGEAGLTALPSLLSVLGDSQAPAELLRAVADTTGRLGPDAATAAPRLGELLVAKGTDVELRRTAAGALDQFGADARSAVPALRKALQDDDRFVRTLALHAIGQQAPAPSPETHALVADVLACLGDRVVEVRVAAAETIAGLGAEALGPDLPVASERLRQATRDGQKAVREAAEQALKKLQPAP